MEQRYTSAGTSINKNKLPAIYGKVDFSDAEYLLDYGCGKYTDHIAAALRGTTYLPYDKYNQATETNRDSMAAAAAARAAGRPVSVVCSNVLNVIQEESIISGIVTEIKSIICNGGAAYITVYEGNGTGTGKQTGRDAWQQNEKTRNYLRFFPGAEIKNNVIVFRA